MDGDDLRFDRNDRRLGVWDERRRLLDVGRLDGTPGPLLLDDLGGRHRDTGARLRRHSARSAGVEEPVREAGDDLARRRRQSG